MKVKVLIERRLVFGKTNRYVADIKVFVVPTSEKFPDGIKERFVLLDTVVGSARLLIDNHEPYGFHVHRKMPKEPKHRECLKVADYNEALCVFSGRSGKVSEK